MIYNDREIREMMKSGVIIGAEDAQVNPASINIRLGYSFLTLREPRTVILGNEADYSPTYLEGTQQLAIMPGEFLLATTLESFNIPNSIAAFVQGRSSIGRIGLSVQNAGFIDPGFRGHITLELKNESRNPIALVPGYPVAQVVFIESLLVEKPYAGKYNGQIEATGSRMELDRFWEGKRG